MTIGNFADKVSLFGSETVTAANGITKELIAEDKSITIDENNSVTSPFSIYVNETIGENPFTISVTITNSISSKETEVEVELNRNSLDRNSIYPISLIYSQYELHLKVTAQIAPIGVLPITVYDSGNKGLINQFIINLPEGCMFTMEASLHDNEGTEIMLDENAYTWISFGKGLVIDNPTIKEESYPGKEINGHLTAFTGSAEGLSLSIFDLSGEDPIVLDYLIITLADPLEDLTSTRAVAGKGSTWSMAERVPERVNLFISKEGGVK